MKKIRINFEILFFALFLFSCNNDFLERYPLDEVSNENYWNSENDLKVYNNYLYYLVHQDAEVPIPSLIGHLNASPYTSIWMYDNMTDNCGIDIAADFDDDYSTIRAGKHSIPTSARAGGYSGWSFLRAVNIGLANYNNATDAGQSVINKYAAEAHLFRGMFYAEKVNKFGDVQWIGKELNTDSEELYEERTPRDQVMDSVLTDLNFATEYLPDDWDDGNAPGKLNRWGALLLKSRACLFEGTWQKYHGGSNSGKWLQEAADAALELIENGPYTLYSTGDTAHDYNAYQRVTDLSGNSEVIWWEKFEYGVKANSIMYCWVNETRGATKSMVEDYLCTDGLPITLSSLYKGDACIEDVFKNRDPRLRQTILHPDDGLYYKIRASENYIKSPWIQGMTGIDGKGIGPTTYTGYNIIKMYEDAAYRNSAWNTNETPAILLRLGEAMLNFAEAKAELGTITQNDLDISINKLRDRVGMPHMELNNIKMDPKYADDGVSALIVEIRRERRVELFNEGFRYDDLRRWKQGKKLTKPSLGILWDETAQERYPGVTVSSTVDSESGKTYLDQYKGYSDFENPVFDEDKDYLWPIPLDVISQNSNIKQNPGW